MTQIMCTRNCCEHYTEIGGSHDRTEVRIAEVDEKEMENDANAQLSLPVAVPEPIAAPEKIVTPVPPTGAPAWNTAQPGIPAKRISPAIYKAITETVGAAPNSTCKHSLTFHDSLQCALVYSPNYRHRR